MNLKRIKQQIIYALLVSLVTLAGMGIWVLVFGRFGDFEWKVLATTLLTGAYSLLGLAFLTQAGRSYQWLAVAGAIASTVAVACGIYLIWFDRAFFDNEVVGRWFASTAVLSFALAHQNLLLLISGKSAKVRLVQLFTLGAITAVALLLILPVATSLDSLPEFYWRIVGVFAILDVLGTVVTPVVARLSK